jgi:glyoxylate reductase
LSLLTEKIDKELLATAPNLKVVSNMAVGVDNIDVSACTARKIPVGHTPGVLTQATADLTFALLLASARRIVEAEAFVRAGKWRTWDPALLLGRELEGATLGIAGFGGIGQAVATRARAFGMRVIYCSRREVRFDGAIRVEKPTLLAQSDFLSLHLPLSIETRHWLSRHEFSQMKEGSVLINAARGPIIDQAALLDALDLGRPSFAALDVTDPEPPAADDPLLKHPKVLVVPHLGSATLETRTKMAVLAADNLLAVLDGRRPKHVVNPEVLP